MPLYKRWIQEFNQQNAHIQVDYLPLGTGEGLKEVSNGKADFGAGEVPPVANEQGMIALPMALIGIVPIFNLPGVHSELHFSADLLAQIFLGEIKTWNAPQLARLNPDIQLPALPIKVVYRPAGKGSNYVLTELLSKNNAAFRTRIGVSASPKWPVGTAAERSSDMADKVSAESGSIGYVELQYAVEHKVAFGAILNPAGKFVLASSETLTAACDGAEPPRWNNLTASLANAAGADAYPGSSFTWIYVRKDFGDPARLAALSEFLRWMVTEGQQTATEDGYAKLPSQLVPVVDARIKSLE
jgi:phosphate transport system substrate-binding protein